MAAPSAAPSTASFDPALPARVVAFATAAYSVAIVAMPRILAKPCGLTLPDGSVPRTVAMLTRSIGVRDAALSTLLLTAKDAPSRYRLSAARVLADSGDALWFGRALPDERSRRKVAAVAGFWALLEASAAAYEASR